MLELNGISDEHKEEVFERVWTSAEDKLEKLEDSLKRYVKLEDIRLTRKNNGGYDSGTYIKDIKSSEYWLNRHKNEMSKYKEKYSMYFV